MHCPGIVKRFPAIRHVVCRSPAGPSRAAIGMGVACMHQPGDAKLDTRIEKAISQRSVTGAKFLVATALKGQDGRKSREQSRRKRERSNNPSLWEGASALEREYSRMPMGLQVVGPVGGDERLTGIAAWIAGVMAPLPIGSPRAAVGISNGLERFIG